MLSRVNRIIAISGPPGAGKSTLAQCLASSLDATFIEYDSYQTVTHRQPADIARIIQTESGYDRLSLPDLVDALTRLKKGHAVISPVTGEPITAKQNIIFETPLGRCHTLTGRLIDRLVWIEVPLDVVLARNLRCYLNTFLQADRGALERNMIWTRDYLQEYLDHVHGMLLQQRAEVAGDADIVIDGRQDTGTQLQELMRRLDGSTGG